MAIVHSKKLPHEMSPVEALSWFRTFEFDEFPPYFLTHWKTGKKFFAANNGLIAYEETSKELVVAGEALSPDMGMQYNHGLFLAFHALAQRKGKGVCGYYVGPDWQPQDFSKVFFGTITKVLLPSFEMNAPEAKEIRRSLRKGRSLNYRVLPLKSKQGCEQRLVARLHNQWQRSKSKLPLKLQFLLSSPRADHLVSDYEEWFAVEKDGEYIAFCSLLPYLRRGQLCFYIDNIIHHPSRDPHALSFLLSFLIEVLQNEGVYELNLGLNPFARTSARGKVLMEKLFSVLYRSPFLYRAKGLHNFKQKFAGVEEPAYCFFDKDENKWRQLVGMAGVTLRSRAPE